MVYRPRMPSDLTTSKNITVFDISASPSWGEMLRNAWVDFMNAKSLAHLCWSLALLDIKLRYRGSVIGPFWLTLSTGVMIGMMGVLYSLLFHMDMKTYFPFLALSILLWNYISSLVTDSTTAFISQESLIRSVRMPFLVYSTRVVMRNILILLHNVVVVVVVDVVLDTMPSSIGLLAIPAFLLWLVVSVAIVTTLGALCARFRDIPPIVASGMQIAFFVSGVMWQPSQLKGYEYLLALNPFFSLLEIVRGPLLGEVPSSTIYISALAYSAVILVLSALLFARVRGRIAFWI
jgi:lipopolysaccharide transport system permease protein